MNEDKFFTFALVAWVIAGLCTLAFWGAVLWLAYELIQRV